jgi:Flp pilus assembly protein TadG
MEIGLCKTERSGRRGQAVVEFALILPLFMLLLFAAVEFGRAYFELHLLANAAREGSRVGSLLGQLEADVSARVDSFLTEVGFESGWTTTIQVRDPTGSVRAGGLAGAVEGDRVAVTVTHSFQVMSGSLIPGFSGNLPLRGRCVFRHE